MSLAALGVDVYQLTTLIAHAAEGRLEQQVAMSFFFRKLPRQRNYVVAAGLRSILEYCRELRFAADELDTIRRHPLLGPALDTPAGRKVAAALAGLDGFVGDIDALPEGTLAFAGPAHRPTGEPARLPDGTALAAYTPLLQVRTSLLLAKLIETPWLSRLNYLSMVASKAARVVSAARADGRERAVIEFGQRRTHPAAAVDAAYAACLAGCSATSNLLATHRYGLPSVGTMDHFAVQAAERAGVPVSDTEQALFAAFCRLFPGAATLLVDTYDAFRGIRNAVRATAGRLSGVRLDSNVTPESVRRARALLDELGAGTVQIFVSDGLDEWRVRELVFSPGGADGFGVGENITCVPDAATGIGAVGKLVVNGYGKPTMKLSGTSGKATLPGVLQVHRYQTSDLLALAGEPVPPGGQALLVPVWRGDRPLPELPSFAESQAHVRRQLAALPPALRALETEHAHGHPHPLVLSAGLCDMIGALAAYAGAEVPEVGP